MCTTSLPVVRNIYSPAFTSSTNISEKIVTAPLVNTPHMTLGTVCVGYFLCIEQTCLVGRIQNLIACLSTAWQSYTIQIKWYTTATLLLCVHISSYPCTIRGCSIHNHSPASSPRPSTPPDSSRVSFSYSDSPLTRSD